MLDIGLAVNALLTASVEIGGIVKGEIYPVAIPEAGVNGEHVKYPVIIYGRSSLDAEYTKECGAQDTAVVTVDCWAKSYEEVINLAKAVRNALDEVSGVFGGVRIQDSELLGATEAYDISGFFGQTLNFIYK